MAENTEHPKRLWIVEEDACTATHFFVREVDVEPLHPDQPPRLWSRYHVAGQPEWCTVELEAGAYRTKIEALECAIRYADDAIWDWEQKRKALEEQIGAAQEEAAAEEEEDEGTE